MAVQIKKAERKRAKLRLGIAGPSGAGKTMTSILMAKGLGGKVGVVDTERGSASLYSHVMDYDVIEISQPYTVAKYREAIKAFEEAGYETIVLDSLTHAWAGEGGLLDKQGKIADSGKGNSYTAWRTVTPDHNALVEAILMSPCHIIATMRSKTDYVQEQGSNGKMGVKKVGMAPIQRDGMEYEFTTFMDVSVDHVASSTKDRTEIMEGQFVKLTKESTVKLGQDFLAWLNAAPEMTEDEKLAMAQQVMKPIDDQKAQPKAKVEVIESAELINFKADLKEFVTDKAQLASWYARNKDNVGKLSKDELTVFRTFYAAFQKTLS